MYVHRSLTSSLPSAAACLCSMTPCVECARCDCPDHVQDLRSDEHTEEHITRDERQIDVSHNERALRRRDGDEEEARPCCHPLAEHVGERLVAGVVVGINGRRSGCGRGEGRPGRVRTSTHGETRTPTMRQDREHTPWRTRATWGQYNATVSVGHSRTDHVGRKQARIRTGTGRRRGCRRPGARPQHCASLCSQLVSLTDCRA